jgi:phage tail tape-measure protein
MINNVKGIIFTAVGSIVGLFIGNKVTDVLNDRFNPELQEAKDEMKQTLLLAAKEVFPTGKDAPEEESATAEETSDE